MTKREALTEARRRWGVQGYAREQASLLHEFCLVGYKYPSFSPPHSRKRCLGHGNSWELAFADADRREKGEG